MLVKRRGGMTEYIPTPKEKREALVRDHFTEVVELLHKRLVRLEQAFDLSEEDAEACASTLHRLQNEEHRAIEVHMAILKE